MASGAPADPVPGLCGTCAHARLIRSDRNAVFCRCALSDHDPRYPRYPMLPVVRCGGYEAADGGARAVTQR